MNKYLAQAKEARQRFIKFKGCDRKVAFETESDALLPGMDVYRCDYCTKFHRTAAKRKWMAGVHTLSLRKHRSK